MDIEDSGGGNVSLKVRRIDDNRLFMIDTDELSKECLVNVIVDLHNSKTRLLEKQTRASSLPEPKPFVNVEPSPKKFSGTQIVEILANKKRWVNKTVRISGSFYYRSSSSQVFSIKQEGDDRLDVSFSELPSRIKEQILLLKNYSSTKMEIFGKLEMRSSFSSSITLNARRIEFIK